MPPTGVRKSPAVRFAAFTALWCVLGAGCQVNPFSVPVDVVTSRLAQEQLQTWEPKVLGTPVAMADDAIGRRNDTLEPLDGGEPWVIYDLPDNPKGETFLVARVSPDACIGQLGVWKRNRDGLLDLWLVRELRAKCLAHTADECASLASLGPATRMFRSQRTGLDAWFHEVRATRPSVPQNPVPPKYVVFCFNDQQRCADVRVVGVTAQGREVFGPLFWPVPTGAIGFPVPSWFPKIPFVPLSPERPNAAPRLDDARPQERRPQGSPSRSEVKGQQP